MSNEAKNLYRPIALAEIPVLRPWYGCFT